MYEIDYQLRHTLSCDKAVILADTCHSGAIGGSIGRGGIYDNSRLVNKYLERVSKARSGIALFTSSQANQLSEEHERWGGGHGVFTHFILEGMKGKADIDQDGIVTAGELFEYVRENVKNETNNRQCPLIGSNYFDSKLPLSIVQSPSNNLSGRLLVATIGISNYRYSHIWQPMERAINDSRAFREMLMNRHHFLEPSSPSSLLEEEATKYNILTFVDSLRSSVHREDGLVFFFSGYTYTHIDEVGSQKVKTGFLVPADVREPKYCRIDCIEIDSFLKSISVIPARHIFVIINSSSDGISLDEITKVKNAFEESSLDSSQKISRVVMISTGDGEISLEDLSDESSLSLFAKAFLFCLSEPKEEWMSQGYVTCSQMISCLKSRVSNLSENKQNPGFSTFFLDQNGEMTIPLDYDDSSVIKEDGEHVTVAMSNCA